MSKLGIFMADGCEEIEGLTVVDLVRRAGIEIEMISVSGEKNVTGSHKIAFQTDVSKADADFASYDGIVLPGGMPGTTHLMEDETVNRVIKEFAQDGNAGLLEGKTATCYPGVEGKLTGANFVTNSVAKDGNIITSRGLGTAIDFAAEIVAYLNGKIVADKLKTSIIYRL